MTDVTEEIAAHQESTPNPPEGTSVPPLVAPSLDPEPLTLTELSEAEHSATERVEASRDSEPEIVAESTPNDDLEQKIPHENQDNETIREEEDKSWPPEDSIT